MNCGFGGVGAAPGDKAEAGTVGFGEVGTVAIGADGVLRASKVNILLSYNYFQKKLF